MTTMVADSNIRIEKLALGPYGTNAYIVVCQQTGDSLVVDAPAGAGQIIDGLAGTRPQLILLTHNHFDHLGAMDELRSRLQVPLAAHAADAGALSPPPERLLQDGDTLTLGKLSIEVLHTPGHTPGSLCFRLGKYLLAGDTLFPGGPGRTGSPEAFRQVVASITSRLFALPDDTAVYPGHGEDTVIGEAKAEYAVFAGRHHGPGLCGDVLWLSS